MSAFASLMGVLWLTAGIVEMRTAITHAKRYEYPPMLGAARYWLAVSALAFLAAVLL